MSEHDGPGGPADDGLRDADLPEAPAWVGELLAGLRADDPPTPADVVARTDAALAALRHSDVLPPTPPAAPASVPPGTTAPADAPGPAPADAAVARTADVVPLERARHSRTSSPWGHRLLLGGVAAAAVLVFGGLGTVAVMRGAQPTTPPLAGGGETTGATTAPIVAAHFVASGQDYTKADLTSSAERVAQEADTFAAPMPTLTGPVDQPGDTVDASEQPTTVTAPTGPTGTTEPTEPTEPSPSDTPSTSVGTVTLHAALTRPSSGCLAVLLGDETGVSVVVDEATYVGRPVYVVIVRPGVDGVHTDVWVVARTCSETDEAVLDWARGS